jgi:hypothetical protein
VHVERTPDVVQVRHHQSGGALSTRRDGVDDVLVLVWQAGTSEV